MYLTRTSTEIQYAIHAIKSMPHIIYYYDAGTMHTYISNK